MVIRHRGVARSGILPGRLELGLLEHGGDAKSLSRPDADHHSASRSGEVGSENQRHSLGGDCEVVDQLGVLVFYPGN